MGFQPMDSATRTMDETMADSRGILALESLCSRTTYAQLIECVKRKKQPPR
jgi:hypothetical protein